MNLGGEFGRTAQRLARNPLGIIALFIVLVYGIAALVLQSSASTLTADERRPLIWFLVVFPPVVLAVFAWLVAEHATKLYAPGDFRGDEAFLRSLGANEQRIRRNMEIQILSETAARETPKLPAAELRRDGFLAEELVLRDIESEYEVPVRRQVEVQGQRFDALFRSKRSLTAVEVKYLPRFQYGDDLVRYLEDAGISRGGYDWPVDAVLVAIVTVDLTQQQREKLKREVYRQIRITPIPVEVRIYELHELKTKFGIDDA